MGRCSFRYTLAGELVATSAVHVGGLGVDGTVDLAQQRDGLSRVLIPGTSLAGAIRSALQDGPDGTTWWGGTEQVEATAAPDREPDPGFASPTTIFDAYALDPDVELEVRDGVSIDRITGAAASRHLFTRYVVPAGTKFRFRLQVEVPSTSNDIRAREHVDAIAELLVGPGLLVGAATTRGLGEVRLRNAKLDREDFTSRAGLIRALEQGGDNLALPAARTSSRPEVLRITVPWRALGPVMSKVSAEAGAAGAFPRTSQDGTALYLLLPGSSIKGVLRSHAERIIRTLVCRPASSSEFVDQMRDSAGLPTIGEIFGTAGDLPNNDTGRRGLLRVHDVTSRIAVRKADWNRVRAAANTASAEQEAQAQARRALTQAVDRLNSATESQGLWFDIAARNAIDRWTGGSADGLLYTTVEPHALAPDAWKPIVLELDIGTARRRNTASVDAMITLVLFLLRDLAEGWIPIGFGTTRGLGALRADATEVRFDFDGEDRSADHAGALHGRSLAEVLGDRELVGAFDNAWGEVIPWPESISTAS